VIPEIARESAALLANFGASDAALLVGHLLRASPFGSKKAYQPGVLNIIWTIIALIAIVRILFV